MFQIIDWADPAQSTEYEAFVGNHRNGSIMQSLGWSRVKCSWNREAIVLRDSDGAITAAMQILAKKLPIFGKSILYAPRGPVCDLHDGRAVAELFEGVKVLAKKHDAYLFKIDPYVRRDDEDFIAQMKELGFQYNLEEREAYAVQSRCNYMLPIAGRTAEEVFASFHSKWRYNIRLAQRRGVECRAYGAEGLDDFYRLMEETGKRDHFLIRPKAYFASMLDSLGKHCRLYLCTHDGVALSGAVATQYAGKTCYVYGASSNEHRNLMPNYLMQWTMIQWAIESGCFLYDFQGIPHYDDETHPNYGVYRFKQGFNGEVVELAGEFDYVFCPYMSVWVDRAERVVKKMNRMKIRLTTGHVESPSAHRTASPEKMKALQ